MQINKAEFKCSSERISQVPKDALKDIAFIGRSNVGKSSLINMLTDSPSLAKVSSTPGKTRLVNHFLVNGSWYLVDLPGYGYARVSKSQRGEFSKLITDYVLRREQMVSCSCCSTRGTSRRRSTCVSSRCSAARAFRSDWLSPRPTSFLPTGSRRTWRATDGCCSSLGRNCLRFF